MKKLIIIAVTFVSFLTLNAQTVPTTTISGNLKVNDSLHVVNNISTTGDIKAMGEVISKDTMRAQKDILVDGNAKIAGNLNVHGITTLEDELYTKKLNLGSIGSSSQINAVTTGDAHLIYFGPISNQSSAITCIPPYTSGTAIFPGRITIPPSNIANINNQLDFRNDGLSSYIEFGHNSSGSPPNPQKRGIPIINTTWPTLKINSLCNGNVELGFGGGTVSTGKFFEVGFPDRNFNIASNIYANGIKTGQRITTDHPFVAVPGYTLYNTQLYVNTNLTRALGVVNTSVNTAGNEVFTIFGDGSIASRVDGTSIKSVSVFNTTLNKEVFQIKNNGATYIGIEKVTTGPHTDAMLTVSGKVACKEVRVFNNTSSYWADFVFDKTYKLLSLTEVESFYLNNKHLPNIPTATEIENNGNDLAKTDALLLQKIEELTMYLVQQQKEIEALKKQINNK